MLVAVASQFHGYPGCDDTEHNKQKAQWIRERYWDINQPVIILVEASDHLESYSPADNEQAIEWCKEMISHVDEVHFWYPEKYGLSPGMKGEWKLAKELGKRCRKRPQARGSW